MPADEPLYDDPGVGGGAGAPRLRNFSSWAQWMLRLDATVVDDPAPVDDVAAYPAWRERAGQRLQALLGPDPEPVPLDVEVTESVDCGPYRRDRIVFDTEPAMSVPAYLLVPHERTSPGTAVLALHGHGPGKAEIVGLEPDGRHDDYAHQLASRGHVVLAPDHRGFGERRDWTPPDKYHCDVNLVHATMAGAVPLAQNLWDLRCALDVLEQHPLVDARSIGAAGLSYGGTLTLFLTALDARVRAAVVSGFFSSWRAAHQVPFNMCGSQVLPGMLGRFEHVDLGALVAPRPLLIESGDQDFLFPIDAARASVAELSKLYDALGAPGALELDAFEGHHSWHGLRAYDFLARNLAPD
ncbi:MAG: Acetyl xylan esterase [Actinomycetia bacterium]|nr:Acetyl xylan esterase [Actinomycetes bacterium]